MVADMARSNPPITSAFVAELARRLQGQSSALTLALSWITHRLAESGHTIEQQIQAEIQQQAAEQVSIANSIGSLRFLGTMDWQEFVETMSVVEQTLRQDPAGVYGRMEFATRDNYRHSVEKIAKHSRLSEVEVAQQALQLAVTHANSGDERHSHVGFYLIGGGLAALEKQTGMRRPWREVFRHTSGASPLTSYLGAIAAITFVATALLLERAAFHGVHGIVLAALGVLALLGSSQLALSLVNWVTTQITHPNPLPRMDLEDGVPAEGRALVVVPTLAYSKDNIEDLCEQLEVRFLANRDPNLVFCLLTDFADAPGETLPGDAALLEQMQYRIEQLNRKYAIHPNGEPATPFLLMHRPRLWNPREGVWMGYERKRGKLQELNRFLRGGARDKFSLVVGDTSQLESIKYVITLDTDTQLPRDAAAQFIATMMHPLNRPRVGARAVAWWTATASCSRVWPSACRARTPRAMKSCAAASRASTLTPAPSRTFTRTCSWKAPSSARASTMSASSSRCWDTACPTTRCSATICWRAAICAPAC